MNFYARPVCLICALILLTSVVGLRAQTLTLEQALNTTNLVWSTGGDAEWFGQSTNSHDGIGAARSGVIGPGQTSWIETTVVGPATLSFWHLKIEARDSSGYPVYSSSLFLDQGERGPILRPLPHPPGGSPWSQHVQDLPAGTNVLRWVFYIYPSATNSNAAGFLDQVVIGPPRPLEITYQPSPPYESVFSGKWVSFSVGAIGTPPLSYQWLKNGTNISDATNAWLAFESATTNDTGMYSVLVSNVQGSVMSSNAPLTILPPSPPIIWYQPGDATACSGQSVSWWVSVDGSPPFEYQWRKDGTNLTGAASYSLSLTNVKSSDGGVYSVEVRNAEGSVLSSNAVLTVLQSIAPVITSQPSSINVASGTWCVLRVEAQGTPEPLYQWLRNGTNIPGAYHSSLWISNCTVVDSGIYSVIVSNLAGGVLSQGSLLNVLPAISLRGSWFQSVDDVFVTNELAYVAQGTGGLGILNVSNPDSPVMLGGCNTDGYANGVRVRGGLAFVADGSAGLQILSVTNPANPIKIGGYDTTGYASDVFVVGHRAYVADGSAGLQIIDISDPAHPVRLGGFVTNMYATSVIVAGDIAYVGCPTYMSTPNNPISDGMQIIDVSNPAQPVLLGMTTQDVNGLDVAGDVLITGGANAGFKVFNVSNSAEPHQVGSYVSNTPWRASLDSLDVQLAGRLAYVAAFDGLWVLDVSNPAGPVNVGVLAALSPAYKLAVVGNRVYVAMGEEGLRIVDIPPGLGVQPAPALSLLCGDTLRLELKGPESARFAIESIEDLSQSGWVHLQTITLTNTPAIVDVSTSASNRFFRARLLQP